MPVNLETPVSGWKNRKERITIPMLSFVAGVCRALRLVASCGLFLVLSLPYFEAFISHRNSSYVEVAIFFSNKI